VKLETILLAVIFSAVLVLQFFNYQQSQETQKQLLLVRMKLERMAPEPLNERQKALLEKFNKQKGGSR
jgi:hypothetical protein